MNDLKKINSALISVYHKDNLDKIVKRELKVRKAHRIVMCPVCSAEVKEGEGLHLQFGPITFRKKATFDGVDCLCYFMENNLKKNKN